MTEFEASPPLPAVLNITFIIKMALTRQPFRLTFKDAVCKYGSYNLFRFTRGQLFQHTRGECTALPITICKQSMPTIKQVDKKFKSRKQEAAGSDHLQLTLVRR